MDPCLRSQVGREDPLADEAEEAGRVKGRLEGGIDFVRKIPYISNKKIAM